MDSEILRSFMEEKQRLIDSHHQEMQILVNEIKRLNKIINDLEKYLEKHILHSKEAGAKSHYYKKVLFVLHKLKGFEKEGEENVE